MTCDSYFTILVKVFTNHILAENTHTFHESCRVRITQDYGLPKIITKLLGNVKTLKTFPSPITSIIHFFIEQKFCKHRFSGDRKQQIVKTRPLTISAFLHCLISFLVPEYYFVKLNNTCSLKFGFH